MTEPRASNRNILAYFRQLPVIERVGLAVMLTVLIGLAVTASFLQRGDILADKEAHVEIAEQIKIGQISSWYKTQITEANEIFASSIFIRIVQNAIASPSKERLAELDDFLRPIQRSYNLANSAIITPDCKVVYALNEFAQSNCDVVTNDISSSKPISPFFTDLHLIAPYAKPGFHLVIPLYAKGQQRAFAYLVQTFFAEDFLYPLLSQWPGKEKTGEILLLRPHGAMITVMNPLKLVNISAFSMQVTANNPNTVEAQAGQGARGILRGTDYRGKRVIATADEVPELGWIILSKMDSSEAFSTWTPTLLIIIAFVFVAIAAALAGAYVLFSVRAISVYRGRLELLKRSERSEALLTAILERIDAPVIVMDSLQEVQFSNQAFKSRFGTALPEGFPSLTTSTGEDTPSKIQYLQLSSLDGKKLHLYVRPMQILLEGQPALLGFVMRDVTELEFALEQVQQLNRDLAKKVETQTKRIMEANEELRSIASAISHNLATPLRAIESFSELLEQEAAHELSPEALDYILRIRRASSNLSTLTDDLVTYLSLDTMALSNEEIDFSLAAQEITSEYIKRNPHRRYQIMIMPGLKMYGDAALLKIGLRNVIENAFTYCAEDVPAKLEIGKIGEFGIYIKDNGVGMDQQEIASILKPSPKADGEEYSPGLSVGLAITKKIIERHGGQLEIESEIGVGTTVRFKF